MMQRTCDNTALATRSFPELASLCGHVPSFSGVVFDFDGTLVDSMHVWEKIDHDFCEQNGVALPPKYMEEITALGFYGTAKFFVERLGLQMSIEEVMRTFNDMAYEEYSTDVFCKPGAKEYLSLLDDRGTKMTIATSLSQPLLEAAMKSNGIDGYFDEITYCNEQNGNKRSGKIYDHAARAIGADPKTCLVFEDIVPGILSAKTIGMTACAVLDEHGQQETEHIISVSDFFIDSFERLA